MRTIGTEMESAVLIISSIPQMDCHVAAKKGTDPAFKAQRAAVGQT